MDTSFGAGTGVVYAPLTRALAQTQPNCKVAVQSNTGRLVLACTVDNGADPGGYRVTDLALARFNIDGTLDNTFAANQSDSDIRPDPIAFSTRVVPANTANVQSNAVTIDGINGPTTVRLFGPSTNGSAFSVGCDGAFTDRPSRISAGQALCVRHHASPTAQATVQTGIDVGGLLATFATQSSSAVADTTPDALTTGGVSGTFSSTTAAADEPAPPTGFPSVFTLESQNNVPRSSLVVSNTVTVDGFGRPITISVSNGEYSVGCNSTFTSASSTIFEGYQLCFRHMSAATFATSVRTDITLESGLAQVTTSFTSTTIGGSETIENSGPGSSPGSGRSGGGGALDYWLLIGLAALLTKLRATPLSAAYARLSPPAARLQRYPWRMPMRYRAPQSEP